MAKRSPAGSAKNAIGIFIQLDPALYEAFIKAAAERDVTKRSLVCAALRRELADPTVTSDQEGLYQHPEDLNHVA